MFWSPNSGETIYFRDATDEPAAKCGKSKQKTQREHSGNTLNDFIICKHDDFFSVIGTYF